MTSASLPTSETDVTPSTWAALGAARVMRRCDELAMCSDEPDRLTRLFLSLATVNAHRLVALWMREAGMTTRLDEVGNLIGRIGPESGPVFLLGSHLDTVPNAGKYDGTLGVLLAIETVASLSASWQEWPFALEVIGFSEEEGVRFSKPYMGSAALAGQFDEATLALRDAQGLTVADALRDFGLDPALWKLASRDAKDVLGYFEAHIEQGPVLEDRELPLGIVSTIVGQTRLKLRFTGRAGHAGTQPMELRRDALVAASEWILAVEALARRTRGLVATVGSVEIDPNAPNVVPGSVVCSLDVRHHDDSVRSGAVETLVETANRLANARKIEVQRLPQTEQGAVPMDLTLRTDLERAAVSLGIEAATLVSGAGHDAVIMANLAPTAMLFLRTPGGASHCPEEAVWEGDVALALRVMHTFLEQKLNISS